MARRLRLGAAVVAMGIFLGAGSAAFVGAQEAPRPSADIIADLLELNAQEKVLLEELAASLEEPTTTTTVATTTTEAPTTTAPPSEVPETLPYGPGGKANAYSFFVVNRDTGNQWWDAPYHFELPYSDEYGWAAGDRSGYRCIWGHLVEGGTLETYPEHNNQRDYIDEDQVVGSFAALSIPRTLGIGDGYIVVNDRFMIEGRREFGGTFTGGGQTGSPGDVCTPILTHPYEPYSGPDERWLVVYRSPAGEVVEIRDYRNVDAHPEVRFHAVDSYGSDGVVAIAAYGPDNLPGAIVYYYGRNGGTVEAILPAP